MDPTSVFSSAWRFVGVFSSVLTVAIFVAVLFDFDSSRSSINAMPFVAVGVWFVLGFAALIDKPNWVAVQKGAAALSAYAAAWMLLGNPDLDDGGQWFAFVFFIYWLPVALVLLVACVHTDRSRRGRLKPQSLD